MKRTYTLLFFLLCPLLLAAHPHMLIYTRCSLEFDKEQISGIWIELEFDRFFGSEIIWAYDGNGDNIFNEEETQFLYEEVFLSLEEYNYFTFIRVGSKRIYPQRATGFSARCDGPEILFFRYFIPMENFRARDFYFAVYDSTFFSACRYQEDYIVSSEGDSPPFEFSLEKNEDYPVYYNPSGAATDKTIYDQWKPGLNTFIPEEIHVIY